MHCLSSINYRFQFLVRICTYNCDVYILDLIGCVCLFNCVCEELFIFGSSFVSTVMIIVGVCYQTVELHFMKMIPVTFLLQSAMLLRLM